MCFKTGLFEWHTCLYFQASGLLVCYHEAQNVHEPWSKFVLKRSCTVLVKGLPGSISSHWLLNRPEKLACWTGRSLHTPRSARIRHGFRGRDKDAPDLSRASLSLKPHEQPRVSLMFYKLYTLYTVYLSIYLYIYTYIIYVYICLYVHTCRNTYIKLPSGREIIYLEPRDVGPRLPKPRRFLRCALKLGPFVMTASEDRVAWMDLDLTGRALEPYRALNTSLSGGNNTIDPCLGVII